MTSEDKARDEVRTGHEGLGYANGRAGGGILMLLGGVALGAGLMYILDPDRGRRRRALLRDQLVSASNKASDAVGKTSRDLSNRAQGVIAETSKALGLREAKAPEQQEESRAAGASPQ
jgi:hypothetical protein